MKNLIPHKIVIDLEKGNFKDGIFLYRIKEKGILEKGYKSIAVKNIGFSKPHMNGILKKMKDHIKKIEKLDGEE